MSSINPVASREIAAVLAEKGIEMLDAPVSGGEPKAIDGTLSFMVGGKQEVFDQYKPVLEAMGSSVVRCGGVGAGNTTKLANQIIVACNIQALAEAMTLARKAGVDPRLVFEAVKGGLAGSAVMNAKAPMMIAGDDRPSFKNLYSQPKMPNGREIFSPDEALCRRNTLCISRQSNEAWRKKIRLGGILSVVNTGSKIDLHIKDLNNALDCAHSVGAPVPMTASVQEILQWLHNHEGGRKDHSAIAQYYEYLTGIKIGR